MDCVLDLKATVWDIHKSFRLVFELMIKMETGKKLTWIYWTSFRWSLENETTLKFRARPRGPSEKRHSIQGTGTWKGSIAHNIHAKTKLYFNIKHKKGV